MGVEGARGRAKLYVHYSEPSNSYRGIYSIEGERGDFPYRRLFSLDLTLSRLGSGFPDFQKFSKNISSKDE